MKFFQSIRWRLQLWHGLILLVVLVGFGWTAYQLQYANELHRVDQELQQRLGPLVEALIGPPGPAGSERRDLPMGMREEGLPLRRKFFLPPGGTALFQGGNGAFYYIVWAPDGHELSRSAGAPSDVPQPERPDNDKSPPETRMRGTTREVFRFTPPGECILVGRSIVPELNQIRRLGLWLSGLGGAVLVLGLAGGWWLAARAIRPIDDISAAATKIATGDLSHRIDMERTDNELGQLAAVLNSTFARLEAAFDRQRQFTTDASHELRTPIAVILSQAQGTLARERDPAEYREALEACERAARRMSALTGSLLSLARLDAGPEPLSREDCDLARISAEALDLIRPLADERGIRLHADLAAAPCRGDAGRLAQLVTILLGNAIDYNHDGGEVRVTTRAEGGAATITVWNTGPGIPAGDLPQIFERFHRADKARSRSAGHTGLGLAIARGIVEAHGGSISAQSDPTGGTTLIASLLT